MPRPLGVTLLAILHYIGAVFAVLFGLAFIFGMGIIGSMIATAAGTENRGGIIGLMAGFGIVFGIFMFLGAAIAVLLGWGLWKLKNWARIVVIALCILRAAFLSLMLFVSLIRFHPFGMVWDVFWLAFNGAVIWYLLQPHVAQAFSNAPPMAAQA